jgi:hypothetical protein
MSLTEIKKQVLELPQADQVALGAFINEINRPVDAAFDEKWSEIVMARAARFRSGETQGVPLEDVMNELKGHL